MMAYFFENFCCSECNSNRATDLIYLYQNAEFQVWKCKNCNIEFQSNPSEDDKRIYQEDEDETVESIAKWTTETFGQSLSIMRIATRANEEMAELLKGIAQDLSADKIMEELADVYITLCKIPILLGKDWQKAINDKMEINRKREWNTDGDGCGYHK